MKTKTSVKASTSKRPTKRKNVVDNCAKQKQPSQDNKPLKLKLDGVQTMTDDQILETVNSLECRYPDDFIIMITVAKHTIYDSEPVANMASSEMSNETCDLILAYAQRKFNDTYNL